jgi:hypothetical protein
MGGRSKNGNAGNVAEQARQDELARQQRIREGTSNVNSIFDSQFNDGFYEGQQKRYIDYAMPQVDDQKRKADKELLFAMDRTGQTEGSVRADLSGELQKRYDLQAQKVRDDGLAYGTNARTNVEGARADLISMLNATGDAEGAATSAVARSAALSQPAAYSPLSNLFADFTGALGTQAAAERAYAYGGGPRPTVSTGLFAPRKGAVALT